MINKYLYHALAQVFMPFFVVLVFISSIILLISLAMVTQFVKLSFGDLAQIFMYSMPNSVFFIIPITFFCSCVLALSRLSFDYELLVFFSLGISPKRILRSFVFLSAFVSLVLLVFSLALIPISKSAYTNFMTQKKAEINVNIRAGEFGQKLGDWLVYVDSVENEKIYHNLVLYSNNLESNEVFIIADRGEIENNNGVFTMSLLNGSAYFTQEDKVQKSDFSSMKVYTKSDEVQLSSYDLLEYWGYAKESNSRARRLAQAIMTSLFPIASVFLILAFGVANPRFNKNLSYVYLLVSVGLYFIIMHILSDNAPFVGSIVLPLAWFIGSYFIYKKLVTRIY